MIVNSVVQSELPKLSSAIGKEPLEGATQVSAAKFAEEQRDLFKIICNNLARLRDELDDDDPRRLLVSSTLRVAEASAALIPHWGCLPGGLPARTRQAPFEWPHYAGGIAIGRTEARHAAKDIHSVSVVSQVGLSAFTPRQRTVLKLLAEGLPTKDIARRLGLGLGTVKVHLGGIYRVTKSRSRLEAVIKAREIVVQNSRSSLKPDEGGPPVPTGAQA
jgi:DNA-binding CsgD family transcriptional regulator